MKKILLILLCILFFYGCETKGTVIKYDNKLEFQDEDGYILSLYYKSDELESVDWLLLLDDEEEAIKMYEHYSASSDMFEATRDGKNLILKYTNKYMEEKFGGVSKDDIEKYLSNNGYKLIKGD